jgi:RHS repeat-associated protein
MLLQRHHSRVCRKKHKSNAHNSLSQRVFKTAPQYAVTNPAETANPFTSSAWTTFTTYLESLWSPTTAATQKSGMSYLYDEDGTLMADTLTGGASTTWGQTAKYIHLPTASGPMPVAAIYGAKHYAIQSDHLNTPRRLVQSDGQVAWQWSYSAFGDEQPTTAKTRFANADLNQSFGSTTVPAVTFNLRYPGQYFDQETSLHYNYHRSYSATTGRYTQADPIGLDGGWNRFAYVDGNPLSGFDPNGLTRRDIDAALNAARKMNPFWRFPSSVKTWSQNGKGGKFSFGQSDVYVDAKYLDCLDDSEATALLITLLHELGHFNQNMIQFGIDNVRERITRGGSSNAQDAADALLWKYYAIVAEYLRNRKSSPDSCACSK